MKTLAILISSILGLTLLTACEQSEQATENATATKAIEKAVVQIPAETNMPGSTVDRQVATTVEDATAPESQTALDATQAVRESADQVIEHATEATEAVTSNAVTQAQSVLDQAVAGVKKKTASIVDSANQTTDNAAAIVNKEAEAAKTTTLDTLIK